MTLLVVVIVLIVYSIVANILYRELERRHGKPFADLDDVGPIIMSVLWPASLIVLAPRWFILAFETWRDDRRKRIQAERAARETPTTKGAYR
jgi:hypothetical protein